MKRNKTSTVCIDCRSVTDVGQMPKNICVVSTIYQASSYSQLTKGGYGRHTHDIGQCRNMIPNLSSRVSWLFFLIVLEQVALSRTSTDLPNTHFVEADCSYVTCVRTLNCSPNWLLPCLIR